jgi:hypothetical protein
VENNELKSNPALLVQKLLRNKIIEAKRNSVTRFLLKRKIGTLFFLKRNETERKKIRNGTKRNDFFFLQDRETKRKV